jgi:hypothetical protein
MPPYEGYLTVSEGTKRENLQGLMVEISKLAIRIYDTTSALNQHKAAMTGIAEKYFALQEMEKQPQAMVLNTVACSRVTPLRFLLRSATLSGRESAKDVMM